MHGVVLGSRQNADDFLMQQYHLSHEIVLTTPTIRCQLTSGQGVRSKTSRAARILIFWHNTCDRLAAGPLAAMALAENRNSVS